MALHVTKNKTESAEHRAAGEKSLNESVRRIEAIDNEWFERFSVEPGSRLSELDKRTKKPIFSEQVTFLAVSSRDHLAMLGRYLRATGAAPPMPGYTLVRTSIESSSLGLWLLSGGTLNKRLLSALRLSWRNGSDLEEWAVRMNVGDPESHAKDRADLLALRDARGPIRQNSLAKFPRWSDIVTTSEDSVPVNPNLTPFQAWKAASGFTHSNMLAAHLFLEHQEIAGEAGEPPRLRMSTRLSTLAMFYMTATYHLEGLLDVMQREAKTTPPHARSKAAG